MVNQNYIFMKSYVFLSKYIAPGTGDGGRNIQSLQNFFTTLAVGVVVLKPHYKINLVCADIPLQEYGMHRQVT